MKILNPDYLFEKTTNITPEFLKEKGITNLLLDVDNTLTTHCNPLPLEGIVEWLALMKSNGINMMIISNNHKKRVGPFAELLGLDFECLSFKPNPFPIKRCIKKLGGTKENTAIVGDQILTDVLGGNICKIHTLMVLAILEEGTVGFKIKREFEKKYIQRYIDTHGGVL